MPIFNGTEGHDRIDGSAGADVMIGGAGSDTYVVDNAGDLVFEDADPDSLAWGGTTAEEPLTLLRTEAGEWCVRVQIEGAPDGVFAEFTLREVSPGVLGVQALRVADALGSIEEVVLADGDSVWEYAFQLGRATDDGSEPEVEFYGGGHQSQVSRGLGIALDGIDFTALPIGQPVNGVELSILQDLDILLPTDPTTRAGSVLLQHVFGASGMTVNHAHDYEEGFVLGGAYSGMLPLMYAGEGGIDWMQIGDGPAQPISYDGTHYYQAGTPTEATAWGDAHNFQVRMSLPTGGPDVNGDWSLAGASGMWLYDTALDYSKIYVNWIDGGRHAAVDSAHVTHYSVGLRDISLPTGATPLPPREASQGVDTILASISLTLPDNIEILRLTGTDDLSGVGNRHNNTLVGNDGSNVLDGGGGTDLLYGGLGDDTYVVRDAGTYIEEKAGEGTDSVLTFMTSHVLGTHFENVAYLGRSAFDGTGNASANRMEGGSAADVLRGLGGDDLLLGGDGDDTLAGGLGADHLVGGAGANLLAGDDGDDVLDGRGGTGTLTGGLGNDIFLVDRQSVSVVEASGEGTDEVRTTATTYFLGVNLEALTFIGSGGFSGVGNGLANQITGAAGGDLLFGEGGDDRLTGLDGNDLLAGGTGVNVLDGGAGIDHAYYAGQTAGVTVNLATGEAINAEGGLDTLVSMENVTGTDHADALAGDAFGNVLNGGAGDDLIVGGLGADALLGGAGIDTLSYADSLAAVDVRLALGQVLSDGNGSADAVSGFESVIGSAFADLISGDSSANRLDGGDGDDSLTGAAGADVLLGGSGVDTVSYAAAAGGVTADLGLETAASDGEGASDQLVGIENLIGSGHDDSLTGDAKVNRLAGGAGADILRGVAGADELIGGTGNDVYVIEDALALVTEVAGEGVDTVQTTLNAWTLAEHLENAAFMGTGDFLGRGNAADNTIIGGDGNDTLSGAGGADALNGGLGVDTVDYSLSASGVRAQLNMAISTNDGDGGADTFTSIENLTGSAFNDTLIGDAGANVLRGGLGADTLLGLSGNDVIHGGPGALNTLQGGLGDDWYVLEAADSVHEFVGEGTDTVEARINAHVLAANVENLVFTGAGDFRGTGNALGNVITGGVGADVLRGGGGTDTLIGGDGADTADYSLAAAGVTARIDQQRATNDGDGATDSFVSIEHLIGSLYADTLIGDGAANHLSGGLGADLLSGGGGNDVLSGGSNGSNQLFGGSGDDWYILDSADTCVEFAGEGVDTVEARIGNYTLRANIENLIYTGQTKFVGTGNDLNNQITGGDQNDVLRGGGGDDIIRGGGGLDELQVRGAKADYTITAQGDGWLVVDSVAGRDGSTYVESIEVIRFLAGNTTSSLSYSPAPLAMPKAGIAAADEFLAIPDPDARPLVSPGGSDKDLDLPLVLPAAEPFVLTIEAGPAPLGALSLDHDNRLMVDGDYWMA